MGLLYVLGVIGLAVVLTPLFQRTLKANAGWPLAALYVLAAVLLTPVAVEVWRGGSVSFEQPWLPAHGITLSLSADGLSIIFAYIALIIGAVVFAYSTAYLGQDRQLSFFLVMATFTFAMLGLVFANDLVLLFICWEFTSLASFLLIARSGQPGEGASMRTLLLTFLGGLFLLSATVLMWAHTGTTSMSEVFADPVWSENPTFTTLIATLVAIAAFTKSAQFPFHVWLPDAMAAITPVSAYLHAAAVVKAGIFLLMRFSPLFHATPTWNVLLICFGLFTSVMGGWFAMQQTDLKKLMAYSTVSQLGLIVSTIGVGTQAALAAALIHTIAHALFKSGLFMMVGVVDHATHTRDLRRLPPKLYRKMPVSFAITALGCASMAGIPPMLGFLSKEELLTALSGAPGADWTGWAALAVAGFGAIITVSYCLKIVFGAFVDGPEDDRKVTGQGPVIIGSAGLPIVVSLPLFFVPHIFDHPIAVATNAALGTNDAAPHFAIWHGVTPELLVTIAVLTIGVAVAFARRQVFEFAERRPFPFTGADVIASTQRRMVNVGTALAKPWAKDEPAPHLFSIFASLAAIGLVGSWLVFNDGIDPLQPQLGHVIDGVLLALIIIAVAVLLNAKARLGATVALSGVGSLATVQILVLGAPDVAMTQLLVETLTVIVIMLVLQKLPREFGSPKHNRPIRTLLFAATVGAGVAALVHVLAGRRDRSELAQYYLDNTEALAGGHNIVNIILVEFRAMDTLGELTVLGMAAVAMVAVLSTVRHQHLDPTKATTQEAKEVNPALNLRGDSDSTAHRAIMVAWPNVIPLQLMLRVVVPLLGFISIYLFLRGHNLPGGGFNAALVTAAIIGLIYLSTSSDRFIGPRRLPLYLIGGGVVVAVATGLLGLLVKGSFLQPLHGHIGSFHISSSMLFDVGVYLAVVGLLLISFNVLGVSHGSVDATRIRVDEQFVGDLDEPLDTVRGDRPARTTTLVSSGVPPQEAGRPQTLEEVRR